MEVFPSATLKISVFGIWNFGRSPCFSWRPGCVAESVLLARFEWKNGHLAQVGVDVFGFMGQGTPELPHNAVLRDCTFCRTS